MQRSPAGSGQRLSHMTNFSRALMQSWPRTMSQRVAANEVVKYVSDLILRSLRSKRLRMNAKRGLAAILRDARKARSSSDNGEAVTRG
jgi:hypothetical protein